MPGSLPESYRRLAGFSSRLSPGTRLYDEGAVPDRFYVVLKGEVLFEVVSERGDTEVVARADPGSFVGHVAAFTGRPTSAAARVEHDAVVLAIPLAQLIEAVREAPELGVHLIRAFAGVTAPAGAEHARSEGIAEGARADGTASDNAPADNAPADNAPADNAPADDTPGERDGQGHLAITGDVDTRSFFVDTATCPVSGTSFEFLRVRTRAVRPKERETDFHVRYEGVNPTWYGIVVCPTCGYAAYLDDFDALDEVARARLSDDREARSALLVRPLSGTRTLEDATVALDLAMRCYEGRGASDSRRAVLQHRRAWLEREAGQATAERTWIARARASYEQAFESDKRLSEEAAARIAYLVGDLAERLGDLPGAAQWLETAVRVAPASSAGIARTARDRLQDVRELVKRERAAS